MARYYFKESPNAEVRRVGDYQGVYTIEDDTLTPDAIFMSLMEDLKNAIPVDVKDNAYYHITQFNNVV